MVEPDNKLYNSNKPKDSQLNEIYQVNFDEIQNEIENVLNPIDEV